jgi:hypothetical protein
MRREQFSAYLASAAPSQSPDDYCRRAARIEEILGFSLDNADLSEQGVAALVHRLQGAAPADCAAALEAYGAFMIFYKAR